MTKPSQTRPLTVKLAAGAFLIGCSLRFVDAYRYHVAITLDYSALFWLLSITYFSVLIALGVFGIWRRNILFAGLGPLILAYLANTSIPDPDRPAAWPEPLPLWIYLTSLALLLLFMLSPASLRWYRNKDSEPTAA